MEHIELEQPIEELRFQIANLRKLGNDSDINITAEIAKLEKKLERMTHKIFENLSAWDMAQLARHPARPSALDYFQHCAPDFEELHGDRHGCDDRALIGGIGTFAGRSCVLVGNNKGREVSEKVTNNFGMPQPEGYRKALRLFELAERFRLPVCTFIDTPGAYPGFSAENHNQSEAIAYNLMRLSNLRTPVVSVVTGEGGSGGALAIGVGDSLMMLGLAIYSVISPEGCASILWRQASYAQEAAEAMKITAQQLKELKLIDRVIDEPIGGAHRDVKAMAHAISAACSEELDRLTALPMDQLLAARMQRLRSYGL